MLSRANDSPPPFRTVLLIAAICLAVSGLTAPARATAGSGFVSAEKAMEYADAGNEGYKAIEADDMEAASLAFNKQASLIPDGVWAPYNLACMNSIAGNVDEALKWLGKAVDNGWDNVEHLQTDPDLTTVRKDPGFDKIVARVEKTAAKADAMFAEGLPRYDTPPQEFAEADAVDAWYLEQSKVIQANGRVYPDWKIQQARMDLIAQKLAALKVLNADDPDFDYEAERIIAMATLKSPWEQSWGSLCSAIESEVDDYLANHPESDKASTVRYRGGFAKLMHCGLDNVEHADWASHVKKAREYLKGVDENSEYYGAAQGLLLATKLAKAGDHRSDLYGEVKSFGVTYKNDRNANRIGQIFFPGDLVRATWPIAINATDLDGNPVSLDNYKGKVVLVDFWATWCGPCRRELPNIVEAYKKYHGDGFEILSISLDYPERTTEEALREWTTGHEMDWTHVYDGENWTSPIVESYFVAGIPAPFLIGKDGSLVAMKEDCMGENLSMAIEKALYTGAH